jgi:hypothetical protein
VTRLYVNGTLVAVQWGREGHLFYPAWTGNVEWITWQGTFVTFDGRVL